jgi:hypothetical protein
MSELTERDETTAHDELQSELAAGLLEAMRGAVAPVLAQLDQLAAEIERREQELRELRQLRTNATRVLHALDPSTKPGPKPGQQTRRKNISDEKVDAVERWLREHFGPDDEFSVAMLQRDRDDFDVVPPGTISFAFAELRERGSIRLDNVAGMGGRKNYKLVS